MAVYWHALLGLDYVWHRRAADGLCLMGGGDIKDPYDMVGKKGRGKSVWLAEALYWMLTQMQGIAEHVGDAAVARKCRRRTAALKKAINGAGWDSQWFLRAVDDYGASIGSRKNREARIHLVSQAWAVFGGSARPQHAAKAMQSVDKYLKNRFGYANIPPERSEVAEAGLSLKPLLALKTPAIAECAAAVEFRLEQELPMGEHSFMIGCAVAGWIRQ